MCGLRSWLSGLSSRTYRKRARGEHTLKNCTVYWDNLIVGMVLTDVLESLGVKELTEFPLEWQRRLPEIVREEIAHQRKLGDYGALRLVAWSLKNDLKIALGRYIPQYSGTY